MFLCHCHVLGVFYSFQFLHQEASNADGLEVAPRSASYNYDPQALEQLAQQLRTQLDMHSPDEAKEPTPTQKVSQGQTVNIPMEEVDRRRPAEPAAPPKKPAAEMQHNDIDEDAAMVATLKENKDNSAFYVQFSM